MVAMLSLAAAGFGRAYALRRQADALHRWGESLRLREQHLHRRELELERRLGAIGAERIDPETTP